MVFVLLILHYWFGGWIAVEKEKPTTVSSRGFLSKIALRSTSTRGVLGNHQKDVDDADLSDVINHGGGNYPTTHPGSRAFQALFIPSHMAVFRLNSGVYLEYYSLQEYPFDITPNPRFLFYSGKHREAYNHLLYGIRERKGFVQITGEVGAGKTTLCRALLEEISDSCTTALILNPALDADMLIKAICMEYGLQVKGMDRVEMMAELNGFLLAQLANDRDTVLIIDEAQDMTNDLLEQIRLLSNLEADDRKLLQIVLMGQPELRDRLNDYSLRQLRQRITVRYHLNALTRHEVGNYIQHRLQVSGANGAPYFTSPALWRIHRYSGGIPRLVNALSDKCILTSFVQHSDRIHFRTVGRAIRELEGNI